MSSSPSSSFDLVALRCSVNAQAEVIKALKKSKGGKKDDPDVLAAVATLQALKLQVTTAEQGDPAEVARLAAAKSVKDAELATRAEIDMVLRHRGFVFPSNEIHNGPAGFFDFGPVGCALKQNLLAFWRQHFILHENMLEIETPAMTPAQVFRTSGHAERFSDWMVNDTKDDTPYRADKLLEEYCEKKLADATNPPAPALKADLERIERDAGAMNGAQLQECFVTYGLLSPSGNALSAPFPFNLMFQSEIGPSGKSIGYLRPETAQGMFVNFKKLLDINAGKMPFAAAQIGPAFRNEIAPRQGLLRVREFTLAEIEHFVNPNDKSHANFADIASLPLLLLPRQAQEKGEMDAQKIPAQTAVSTGVINNETLAYFMARTQQFLIACGIKSEKLRFRQHKATEMAHYASDCWDAEILSSYGWIECVGHADRAAYDLDVHSKATGADLTAQETYAEPKAIQMPKFDIKNAIIGKAIGKKSKDVTEHIRALPLADAMKLEADLASAQQATITLCTGESFQVTRAMISITSKTEMIHTAKYTPNVIEPAFGIGRIFYSILEHTYYVRPAKVAAAASTSAGAKDADDDAARRTVFALPAHLAPTKLSILPISNRPEFEPIQKRLAHAAVSHNITYKVDASSGSIGRRYARADEIGIPFGITIDVLTETDQRVTIRERDSMQQIRVDIDAAIPIIEKLAQGHTKWETVFAENEHFTG